MTYTFDILKELSFCHKLWLSNPYIFATRCRRPLIFQTMISVISNCLSLKYQRFTPSGCKEIMFRKCMFVAKTQFLYGIHGWPSIYWMNSHQLGRSALLHVLATGRGLPKLFLTEINMKKQRPNFINLSWNIKRLKY